jgi:L,D-peptidoglycan transpeptidase YkuD (ErfK/YbiS/YcfS/YnhG family)
MIRFLYLFALSLIGAATVTAAGASPDFRIPAETTQLLLGLAEDWNSSHATLQRFERAANGPWKPAGAPWPARLGADGLAWGRGLHPEAVTRDGNPVKQEGDDRSPAGVFALGKAYGYAPDVTRRPGQPYCQVGEQDLWVEDVTSPYYNQHLRLNHPRPENAWEKKQQMRLNDPAHSLKLFIAHNAGSQTQPGAGSSIFFHIWRKEGAKPSSGCTVMAESRLRDLIAWVEPDQHPLFVLLPRPVYVQMTNPWNLPALGKPGTP